MSSPRARSAAPIAARVLVYFAAAWGAILTLSFVTHRAFGFGMLAWATYTTIPLLAFLRWRGWPFYPKRWFRLLVVRPFWYTQLLLPLVAAGTILGAALGAVFGHAAFGSQFGASIVFLACGAMLIAGYVGSHRLVVRHVDANVPDLPAEFDGLRIAQLSDLHVGPHTSRRFLQRVVDATQAVAPDLIAVTGDLIDDRAEDVAIFAEALGALHAPLGTYLIAGNHDVYAGWDAVESALVRHQSGTLLLNDAHMIRRGNATLALVGTGDPAGGGRGASRAAPDVARALSRVPAGTTVIALAHNPALFPLLAERGVALTLSGHTHWGQFAFPSRSWNLASLFLERSMMGHQLHEALLYISPGTGYWGIPFRLGAYPEVTVVTLRCARSASVAVHPAAAA